MPSCRSTVLVCSRWRWSRSARSGNAAKGNVRPWSLLVVLGSSRMIPAEKSTCAQVRASSREAHLSHPLPSGNRAQSALTPTFWSALQELGGELSLSEFFGSTWHVHDVSDYALAIHTVRVSRENHSPLIDPRTYRGRGELMNPRIYWGSHLTNRVQRIELQPVYRSLFLQT